MGGMSGRMTDQRRPARSAIASDSPAQRTAAPATGAAQRHWAGIAETPVEHPDRFGLPDWRKTGIEALSGGSLDNLGERQGQLRNTSQSASGALVNDDAGPEHKPHTMRTRTFPLSSDKTPHLPQPAANSAPPIQRAVLHKINQDGTVLYYSDLEKGKKSYKTEAEAKAVDDKLSSDPIAIGRALYTKKGVPKRANTPYSYGPQNSVSAAPDSTDQGPHTVGFAAQEYRLQNRISKNQHDTLAGQILSPDEFEQIMDKERNPKEWENSLHRKRMILDYRSLHNKWLSLYKSDNRSIGSEFHLVTHQIMQMHPYTTYGMGVKSVGKGERENSRFGTRVLDKVAYRHAGDIEELQRYYAKRQPLFHSSDDESNNGGFEPYEPRIVKSGNPTSTTAAASSSSPSSTQTGHRRSSSFGMSTASAANFRPSGSFAGSLGSDEEHVDDDFGLGGPSSAKRPAYASDDGELADMEDERDE